MDGPVPATPFRWPQTTFADLAPATVGALVASAADVAVVLDDGLVRDVAFGDAALASAGLPDWVARPWAETVTIESRSKVVDMLADAANGGQPRWRHVNHPAEGGDVPIRYLAVAAGPGRAVAVGRDLRATAQLQQRILTAQQAMERDHIRLREAERRYRALFDASTEPVLVVESARRRVVDANPAAQRMVGSAVDRLLAELVHPDERDTIAALAGAAVAAGQGGPMALRLADGTTATVTATPFRQDRELFLLVRLRAEGDMGSADDQRTLERIPDAFVLTDETMAVVAHNSAFLDLVGAARAEEVTGAPLGRWLGRPGIDLEMLRAELVQHGVVRAMPTIARGSLEEDVEVSAVRVPDGGRGLIGMTVRAARRAAQAIPQDLPRSVEQLTQLVGRVSLKEIVRESTDLIERLCIEAALSHTRDNRASAAEILGLSRQSLYAKLHRHGLGNLVGQAI